MAIAMKHNGVYRFINSKYPTAVIGGTTKALALKSFGTIANGRNVALNELSNTDTAQQWRTMYAGITGSTKLYWLNCELGGRKKPFALDRFTGSGLTNNADVYKAVDSDASDQIIYFTEVGTSGRVFIRLYGTSLALTAASAANGSASPASLTASGNCYWSTYSSTNTAQQWESVAVSAGADMPNDSNTATTFPVSYFYTAANNSLYPTYVGECTWYCCGRFYQAHSIKNVCVLTAYKWATGALPTGVSRQTKSGSTYPTPRNNSVGVFGTSSTSPSGHVVFIESVSGQTVKWSDCNGSNSGGTFDYSNGQIEAYNTSLTGATDGRVQTSTLTAFQTKFGSGLQAVIYKA